MHPQFLDSPGVYLRDPGLTQFHHLGDFLQVQVLLIVQRKHDLLILPQAGDPLRKGPLQFLLLQDHLRLSLGVAGGHFQLISRALPGVHQQVQRKHVAQRDICRVLLIALLTDTQMVCDLRVRRLASKGAGQLCHGHVNFLGPFPDVPGHPVLLPGQVDHHPPNPLGHIGLELHAFIQIELIHRAQQRDNALIDNIVNLCEAAVHAPNLGSRAFNQALVPQHQGPFQALVPGLLIQPQQVLGVHGLDFLLSICPHGSGVTHVPTALLSAWLSRVMFPMAWIWTALVISLNEST